MPIEIRELHIRVSVNQPESGTASAPAANAAEAGKEDKEGVIRQCIEQVIDLMNAKKER